MTVQLDESSLMITGIECHTHSAKAHLLSIFTNAGKFPFRLQSEVIFKVGLIKTIKGMIGRGEYVLEATEDSNEWYRTYNELTVLRTALTHIEHGASK